MKYNSNAHVTNVGVTIVEGLRDLSRFDDKQGFQLSVYLSIFYQK